VSAHAGWKVDRAASMQDNRTATIGGTDETRRKPTDVDVDLTNAELERVLLDSGSVPVEVTR
jgi:hypothetical protein